VKLVVSLLVDQKQKHTFDQDTHSFHFFGNKTDFGQTIFAPSDTADMKRKQESELMNGRLAMCAIGGIATQSIISGHGFPYV
jgi:hypothetical protein